MAPPSRFPSPLALIVLLLLSQLTGCAASRPGRFLAAAAASPKLPPPKVPPPPPPRKPSPPAPYNVVNGVKVVGTSYVNATDG